jgi:hypothetical protein
MLPIITGEKAMPKNPKVVYQNPLYDLDAMLAEEASDMMAVDMMQGFNQFVQSAIELTKLVVATEQSIQPLDRKAIFAIYNEAMANIGKSMAGIAQACN